MMAKGHVNEMWIPVNSAWKTIRKS